MANLLRSDGGIELSPEVCLVIIEQAIGANPKVVGNLMRVSKPFQQLLESYKNSILKCVMNGDTRLGFVNISQERIHDSSRMPLGIFTVDRTTYSWFSEIRCRAQVIDFLVKHEMTEMTDPQHHWPFLDIGEPELEKRLSMFKRDGLHLLYRLSDCAAGFRTKQGIRGQQAKFLVEELRVSDLAALGAIVEVMGQGFFNTTNKALQQSGLLNASGIRFSNLSALTLYRPSSVPIQDLNNQHWIRECMCVFEDLIQLHGPCFAYAYAGGWKHKTRRPDLWARMMLQNGLDDMHAFEMGHTMSFASLQSVVWRIFCKKVGCSQQNSWYRAKTLVEDRISGYTLEGGSVV